MTYTYVVRSYESSRAIVDSCGHKHRTAHAAAHCAKPGSQLDCTGHVESSDGQSWFYNSASDGYISSIQRVELMRSAAV